MSVSNSSFVGGDRFNLIDRERALFSLGDTQDRECSVLAGSSVGVSDDLAAVLQANFDLNRFVDAGQSFVNEIGESFPAPGPDRRFGGDFAGDVEPFVCGFFEVPQRRLTAPGAEDVFDPVFAGRDQGFEGGHLF